LQTVQVVGEFVVVESSVEFPLRRVFRHAGRDVNFSSPEDIIVFFILKWSADKLSAELCEIPKPAFEMYEGTCN
jgi:hypothetical protein